VIALRGARLVLPDRILDDGTLLIDGPRIADIASASRTADTSRDLGGAIVVPGLIDVHVHGVEGFDTLDAGWPVADVAARLTRYGVTAFCPTTVACSPAALTRVLQAVQQARATARPDHAARVLPAHLESNFINPEFRGAQPAGCLRLPPGEADCARLTSQPLSEERKADGLRMVAGEGHEYTGEDILRAIDCVAGATGVVTLAPELPCALDLIEALVARGLRVSLGHSGASHDEALAGFDAGARRATHLFNRMAPLHHRDPGLAGATLAREDVDAELICDGFHVHPTAAQLAIRLKSRDGVLAITDGTAGSGLAVGSRAHLGGRPITVTESAAFLEDGTLAGSTLTMDRALRTLVERFGCALVDAVAMCAANPARACGLSDQGVLRPGALADFVVMTPALQVVETWIDGRLVWNGSIGQ
jgi:N-acetylglucosamine-6-phosphate deacetylase